MTTYLNKHAAVRSTPSPKASQKTPAQLLLKRLQEAFKNYEETKNPGFSIPKITNICNGFANDKGVELNTIIQENITFQGETVPLSNFITLAQNRVKSVQLPDIKVKPGPVTDTINVEAEAALLEEKIKVFISLLDGTKKSITTAFKPVLEQVTKLGIEGEKRVEELFSETYKDTHHSIFSQTLTKGCDDIITSVWSMIDLRGDSWGIIHQTPPTVLTRLLQDPELSRHKEKLSKNIFGLAKSLAYYAKFDELSATLKIIGDDLDASFLKEVMSETTEGLADMAKPDEEDLKKLEASDDELFNLKLDRYFKILAQCDPKGEKLESNLNDFLYKILPYSRVSSDLETRQEEAHDYEFIERFVIKTIQKFRDTIKSTTKTIDVFKDNDAGFPIIFHGITTDNKAILAELVAIDPSCIQKTVQFAKTKGKYTRFGTPVFIATRENCLNALAFLLEQKGVDATTKGQEQFRVDYQPLKRDTITLSPYSMAQRMADREDDFGQTATLSAAKALFEAHKIDT